VAEVPKDVPGQTADRTLDDATRQRLLETIREELTRVSREALARGVSPEELAAQLDERIRRLRGQVVEQQAEGES
jgi:hypothetical protein